MPKPEVEIVVEDPGAPADDSPALTSTRTVDVAVSILLLGLALLLAFDNWRTGISWDSTGPQAGYFPFYLAVILAAACLYGLGKELLARRQSAETFVTRAQFWRVIQVFVPTLLFAGFMIFVGRIAAWKAVLTALVFSLAMFLTFDIAFDVIMPKGPLEALFGH
jgi:hypothetical protein